MRLLVLGAAALIACGCGHGRVYLNRDVTTAVVLAPLNESLNVDAPWKMWKYVERQVASRGFRVVDHAVVVKFYEDKGFTGDPGQIESFNTEELAKIFKVDAVVWSNILAWEAKTLGIYNSVEVKLEAEIHDKAGAVVWKGSGSDGYSAIPSRKGMLASALGAAFTDPEKYAPGAAANCFGSLPWAGWDPEAPRPVETK